MTMLDIISIVTIIVMLPAATILVSVAATLVFIKGINRILQFRRNRDFSGEGTEQVIGDARA